MRYEALKHTFSLNEQQVGVFTSLCFVFCSTPFLQMATPAIGLPCFVKHSRYLTTDKPFADFEAPLFNLVLHHETENVTVNKASPLYLQDQNQSL